MIEYFMKPSEALHEERKRVEYIGRQQRSILNFLFRGEPLIDGVSLRVRCPE